MRPAAAAATALVRAGRTVPVTDAGSGPAPAGEAPPAAPLPGRRRLPARHTDADLPAARAVHTHLAGDPRALDEYGRSVTAVRTTYLRNHRNHNAAGRRRPARPFWQRRHHPTPEETP
ncbi:hypothetical protein ACFYUY_33445 [Kitasatospora sp. NPDC004745]|uniref:hypothetical protein n=1 Tax=Kitasatospora sp. NPDC004745 TaxID=3364019 RepID=UPI003686E710